MTHLIPEQRHVKPDQSASAPPKPLPAPTVTAEPVQKIILPGDEVTPMTKEGLRGHY